MGLTLQKLERLHPSKRVTLWLFLLIALCFGFQQAKALNQGSVSITNKSGTNFILDSNTPLTGPRAAYVAYTIRNISTTVLTSLSATLSGLEPGFALAGGQTATQSIGTLQPGDYAYLFWYLSYPETPNSSMTVKITVSDSNPGVAQSQVEMKTKSSISSTAGGSLGNITFGPGLILGSTTYFDLTYDIGNIPKNGFALFQPAGNMDFLASCFKLKGTQILSSDVPAMIPPGTINTLNFVAQNSSAGGGSNKVTVRYTFEVACSSFNTELRPYGASNSGSQIKHTPNYGNVLVSIPSSFPPPVYCGIGAPEDFAIQQTATGIASTGDDWSVSWGDYDNDNYPDLFLTTHEATQPNALYHNNGNGTFTKATSGTFNTDIASSASSTWGDYDNDGDLDLYVANNIGTANFLYRNEGGGNFTKIQNDPIVSYLGYSHGVTWADYDNDGFLDMFIAVYWETAFNLLYHNNGDGTFSEVTNNAITNEASRSVNGAWGDYDNDGLQDLFVTNTGGQNNSLYHNLGDGNFERITSSIIVNDGGSSVGASWGDYNNDGFLDLVVANAGSEACFLYKNNGNGTFTKITTGPLVTEFGHAHGSAWADWDNDGDLDLFIARDGLDNSLYRNDGTDVFTQIQNDITNDGGLSRGGAWADYDHDGDLDLIVTNRDGTGDLFYKNVKGNCNKWASIKLIGTNSNKSAVGARVAVTATINNQTKTQIREVRTQTGGGTGGQGEMALSFGLGNATIINSISIKWPSGFEQVISNQPVNQFLQFTETNGAEVCGTVYYDANENCIQDTGDYGIAGTKITLTPGGITAYTDDNGNYSVFVKTGTYTVHQQPSTQWNNLCPNTQGNITVNASVLGGTYCGNNFGNKAMSTLPDLATEVVTTSHRIGENNLLVVNYENLGVGKADGALLEVTLPAEVELLVSSLPYTTTNPNFSSGPMVAALGIGQTIYFDLGTLPPNAKGSVFLSYTLPTNTPIGTQLMVQSLISSLASDLNPSNNASANAGAAVASFDPNDIAVSPVRYVKRGEQLQYKIRFQNVGNFSASQIRVEDELPEGLDVSTLELGSASHTYKFQADGRKLTWTFPNINLPDSLTNEPASHGYITFRIKPSEDLAIGERMLNRAAIFFDNLEPVITNTVENILTSEIKKESKAMARSLQIYPNPTSGKLTVQSLELSQEPDAFFVEIGLYDQFGRQVYGSENVSNQRKELYLFQIATAPGTYLVKAVDSKGRPYFGKVMVVK